MKTLSTPAYIPGIRTPRAVPLARFLPPVEEGVIAAWLSERFRTPAWVLDPFGASPRLAVEAARAGYRVLVAANNPVVRFLLQMFASPPSEADLKSVLAALASLRKGDELLETHLKSLYQTECASCRETIMAEAFLWRRGEETPFARIYRCPFCGEGGEHPAPATSTDRERAVHIAASAGLHWARALERVAPLDDPDRGYAEEVMNHHLPRAIYVLGTLLNRMEALSLSPERRRYLEALLLTTCDAANTLWPYPTARPRPRQLTVPTRFYERNLWLALEDGIALWASDAPAVPLTIWPQEPPESGGICLFEGRVRDLAARLQEKRWDAAFAVYPRPNQAFWSLSALWAGWLWGREVPGAFKRVLRRRRYDWQWHAGGLQRALSHLAGMLPSGKPFFALLAEAEPSFLTAALSASILAGFRLEGLAMRTVHDPVQFHWRRLERPPLLAASPDAKRLREAMSDYLRARGEPTTYLTLHAAALLSLAAEGALVDPAHPIAESMTRVHESIRRALEEGDDWVRYGGSEHSLEVGLWGLREMVIERPLGDRVEIEVVRFLQRHPGCTLQELLHGVFPRFPGLLTPSLGLILEVLRSYGVEEDGRWRLRQEDIPSSRRADLMAIADRIETIGRRLRYPSCRPGENILLWKEGDEVTYAFYVLASAVIGRVLSDNPYPPERSLIVLPGGRAGLLAYKLRRDPALAARARGYRFVKFRLLRALAEIPLLSRQTWEEQLASDPIEHAGDQLMLF